MRKFIKHPKTADEYRYDEELLGDGVFRKPGQHWVTTADKSLTEEDRDDFLACSNALDAVAGGQALAAKELGEITRTIDEIDACKAQCVKVGVPHCKFLLDKNRLQLERNRDCLLKKAPDNDLFATLQIKLRLNALTTKIIRDVTRANNLRIRRAKAKACFKKALVKKERTGPQEG